MATVFVPQRSIYDSNSDRNRVRKWWIDDDGRWHEVRLDDPDPAKRNPIPPSLEMESVALRHFGFVKLLESGSHLRVKWDVRHVSEQAIAEVQNHIDSLSGTRRIWLQFFHGAWASEHHEDATEALRRIETIGLYREALPLTRSHRMELDPTDIKEGPYLISRAFSRWQKAGKRATKRQLREILPYSVVVSASEKRGAMVVHFVGQRSAWIRVHGPHIRHQMKNRSIHRDLPGNNYFGTINGAYYDALTADEPVYDHVRAFTQNPGDEPRWITYRRLLLPDTNSAKVFCFANLTDSVAVPPVCGSDH
jgi:hypothetical protein